MTRKEYILYLSSNTLPKSVIDSKITAPIQPLYITPYEQAVLNGFKWSEKVFDIKLWTLNTLYYYIPYNVIKLIKIYILISMSTFDHIIGSDRQDLCDRATNTEYGILDRINIYSMMYDRCWQFNKYNLFIYQ